MAGNQIKLSGDVVGLLRQRAEADGNAIISALNFGGKPLQVLSSQLNPEDITDVPRFRAARRDDGRVPQ
jgi:hypothetical protein